MASVRLSLQAEQDLLTIADAESDRGPRRAMATIEAIERALALLRLFPGVGHKHPDLDAFPDLDTWHVGGYAIIFQAGPEMVNVLRIVASASDLASLDPGQMPQV